MRALLIGLGVLVSGFGAGAQEDSPLTTLVTGDDVAGYEAVGRLNLGRRSFCTGALIAPDLVLTAAHCLFDDSGRPIPVNDIEFLAGWRNKRANAHRGVREAIAHPDYEYSETTTPVSAARDVAVLRLDQPIRNSSIVPFETTSRPRKGDQVDVVSYAQNRSSRPSLQQDCLVLARPNGALILSCLVDFGASGSPIFVTEDGVSRIASVVSSKSEIRGRSVSFGTGLEQQLADIMEQMDTSAPPTPTAPRGAVVRRLTEEEPRDGNGSKFLRP